MNRELRWTTRASDQLADTALFLDEARPGFGHLFLVDVEALATSIESSPRRYPEVPQTDGEVRRALVLRFGYWLIYEVESDRTTVLAVWHGRQAPDGWR
jgi:plasmid stabilization system protein ParE